MRGENIIYDVVVLGGGLAALAAAYAASNSSFRVLIISKGKIGGSGNTLVSAGGLAASVSEDDSPKSHFCDTLTGGAEINDHLLVRILTNKAVEAIEILEKVGVRFLSSSAGKTVRDAPGHRQRRFLTICNEGYPYRGKGQNLTKPFIGILKQRGVQFLDKTMATSLNVWDGRVFSVTCLSNGQQKQTVISAKAVILATGGAGRMFSLTNNTTDATGDGYALALKAGAFLRDMEFIQFFPTYLVHPFNLTISTSVFADGAVLLNNSKERFAFNYSSKGELATRDVLARAIFEEIQNGRGFYRGVRIDFSTVPQDVLEKKHLSLMQYFHQRGLDLKEEHLEVAPVTHHFMGGVAIDERCHTNVLGLYACGEVAGGVHGANRLAGNALTEAMVFGLIAGKEAARFAMANKHLSKDYELQQYKGSFGDKEITLTEIKRVLSQAMQLNVGIKRTEQSLLDALEKVSSCATVLSKINCRNHKELSHYYELCNLCLVSETVIKSALARQESRGSHYREDYSNEGGDAWVGSHFINLERGKVAIQWKRNNPV